MFSIVKNQAIEECSRIERQVSVFSEQAIELEQAIRGLRRLSGMDEPIARLLNQCAKMDFQYTVLKQMMQALNKSTINYMSCENRICDYSEQNVIVYARQEIGVNDFSSITNILSGI